ncbi:MAG: tRNA (adenosine(37)-N6)-dimethylallyltransferase MiaA, partial [Clostridia bacterium]|nr:tRNA (adenosine(37)-N6)-dimethylallyltransferase MiaA [Clostridia bacterium]
MNIENKIPLTVIIGATASGKSSLALKLAKAFNGELISGDSMQIYRGMDIGTAKPTEKEREDVKHHLVDIADIDEVFSAGRFVELAA